MERRRFLAVAFGIAVAVPSIAGGEDEAAVREAVLRHYAAINAGDLGAVIRHHTPHFTGFLGDNGLLHELESREHQQQAWGPAAAAGWKWNVDLRHLQVRARRTTAVATFYAVGSLAFPGQTARAGTWRVTEVWVKEGGQRLELHHHDSLLVAARPSDIADHHFPRRPSGAYGMGNSSRNELNE